MSETTEKVYCVPTESSTNNALIGALMSKQETTPAEISALMQNGNQWNNPFMYLIWLCLLGGNGNGLFGGNNQQSSEVMSQLSAIRETMAGNQNSNLLLDAINGNHDATHELANSLNLNYNALSSAVAGVQSAIQQVGGQVGFSSERVINSVLLGNKDLTSALQSCCCENKQLVQKMGYDNQIATLNQTSALQERLNGIANGITQGFASTAYETQKQTCDIITANNSNTQAIKDLLNQHWQQETALQLQDSKFEVSQMKQNQYLGNLINGNGGQSIW